MFFKNVRYIKSAPEAVFYPEHSLNEFLLIGKSNVGKSSLINALCNSKVVAKVSSTPGHTKYLNFFNVNNEFCLVDSPGYGYAVADRKRDLVFAKMMNEYLNNRDNLRGAALLIDSKRVPDDDDITIFNYLLKADIPFIIVATKCDRLNQSEKSRILSNLSSAFKLNDNSSIYLSFANRQKNFDEIIRIIYKLTLNQDLDS